MSRAIDELAERFLRDRDNGNASAMFASGVQLAIEEAYALQEAVADLRIRRGESMIGYKVGCTSPAIREQLGIQDCISGRLWNRERWESGADLKLAAFPELAIEGGVGRRTGA